MVVGEQYVVDVEAGDGGAADPLGLDAEEDPDPAAEDLEQLEGEDGALPVGDAAEVRAQLEAPRAAQQQVQGDDAVVQGGRADVQAAAQAERLEVGRGPQLVVEERQVPVLGHVPVEAVERVDGAGGDPGAVVVGGWRLASGGVALQGAEDDDGEGRRVLERVGQVLAPPARGLGPAAAAHAAVLDEALPQPDQRRQRHDQGHHDGAAAVAVGARRRAAPLAPEEHAQRHVQVRQHFRVARQHVGQQDVPELAVLGLGDAADRDALQRRAEAHPSAVRQVLEDGYDDEEPEQYGEVHQGDPVPGKNQFGVAMGEDPEDE